MRHYSGCLTIVSLASDIFLDVFLPKLSGKKTVTYYSFSQLLKHYKQAFELKFQNHNAIYQKAHPFP